MRSRYLGKAFSGKPVRRSSWALWLAPPFLVLGLACAAYLKLHGIAAPLRLWEASRIEVRGNHVLLASDVERDAHFGSRVPWLFLDPREVRSRLLDDPWICAARVSRGIWRRVYLDVEERSPQAIVPYRRGMAELDQDGVLLPLGRGRVPADLPVLTGLPLDRLKPGAPAREPRILAALEFLSRCRSSHAALWRRVSELRMGDPALVRMTLEGTDAEVWLRPEALTETKLALLATVLPDVERRAPSAVVVDLRFRDQVVLKTAETASKAATPPEAGAGDG